MNWIAGRRTTPDTSIDKDEGISDDMDDLSLSELRLQLELNEQETAILRRKMEDMEGENDRLSREVLELQELVKVSPSGSSDPARSKSSKDQEMAKLKVELMEKNKEIVHLNEALTQAEKSRSKVVVQRSRSLEGESSLDLKVPPPLTHSNKLVQLNSLIIVQIDNYWERKLKIRCDSNPGPEM